MKPFFHKFIISIIGLSIALNPLFVLIPEKAKAADSPDDGYAADTGVEENLVSNLENPEYAPDFNDGMDPSLVTGLKPASNAYDNLTAADFNSIFGGNSPQSVTNLIDLVDKYSPNNGSTGVTFTDIFTNPKDASIILTPKDKKAAKQLLSLNSVIPNFENDYQALYSNVSAASQAEISSKINSNTTVNVYLGSLQHSSDSAGRDKFNKYITEANKNFTPDKLRALWTIEATSIEAGYGTGAPIRALVSITGISENDIRAKLSSSKIEERRYISSAITSALDSLILDVRVINSLVYLVTPKDEGGAGHWRIKVARILQDAEKSKESVAVSQINANTATPTLTTASAGTNAPINCDDTMTAAECGSQQSQGAATVTDTDGTEYAAFFTNMDKELENNSNISTHHTGQAFDVSQVDDLRCTLVKKKRIGKTGRTAQPIKPIKLAWQTTDGWNKSVDSSTFDQMTLMKDLAKQSVVDMLSSMNENISDYEGDLTKANFNDLIGILGQSLLGQVAGSTGHNLAGYDVTSTLQSLGTVYLADYFGLPREIFSNAKINSLDDFKYVIGRSAIEKRLGLPYSSLDDVNLIASKEDITDFTSHDLTGLLFNIGQRKIEHEMGLDPHDLDRIYSSQATANKYVLDYKALGRIVIEDELNLIKGSWPQVETSFGDLKNYISDSRVALLSVDLGYIDSLLHLDPGTTKAFKAGRFKSETYAEKVGRNRYNNTTAGLKYFAMNNSAYQLPSPTVDNPGAPDTWANAMKGQPEAIKTIGIYTLARLLGENSSDILSSPNPPAELKGATVTKMVVSSANTDYGNEKNVTVDRAGLGQFVFREWLRQSIRGERVTAVDGCAKPKGATPDIVVNYQGQSVLAHPSATDINAATNKVCPLLQTITFNQIEYNNGSKLIDKTIVMPISESTGIASGLSKFDLNSIMGYQQADGRSVFSRIGSKLLYYAIANKAASPEERAAIDLTNTNPSLDVSNNGSTVAFYVSRAARVQELAGKIKNEWDAVSSTDKEAADIKDKINKSVNDLKSIYSDTDLDLTKITKIASSAATVARSLSDIKRNLEILRDRYSYRRTDGSTGTEVKQRIEAINALLFDVNEMYRVACEILSGQAINTSDSITIKQFNANAGGSTAGSDSTGLSSWQIMLKIFTFLTGKMTPDELILEMGANAAESSLGLPTNSLLYLAQNYEKSGIVGTSAFFQSLGQAQIEQTLGLPMNYFQGNEVIKAMPKFDKTNDKGEYADLLQWTVDTDGKSIITTDYNILFANITGPSNTDVLNAYIRYARQYDRGRFNNWQKIAKKRWLEKNKQYQAFDKTIDNVVRNISDRGMTDGIRSAENDLLFRLGFPTGNLAALKNGSPIAWQAANARSLEIDTKLGLPAGYTKMLFTGSNDIQSASIGNDDKDILSAQLGLSRGELEKYIQILNREVLPSENGMYQADSTLDYVSTNPYADPAITGPICPINYTQSGGFVVSETVIPSDSFCYYDNKGRHCFQSRDEAERYSAAHQGDRITDIIGIIASKVANQTGQMNKITEITASLRNFVNNNTATAAFDDNTMSLIFNQAGVPTELRDTLFTRKFVGSQLALYKNKVGLLVSGRVLTTSIFNSLSLDIDPSLFDGNSLYQILTGDFSPLGRMATTMVDRSLDLPAGTTMLIYTATSQNAIKCALSKAGGTLLGEAFGLSYLPLNRITDGDFIRALGEEKIEETLSLPRGTFRVDDSGTNNTLENLIKNVGPINFTVAFNLPIDLTNKEVKSRFDAAMKALYDGQRINLTTGSPNSNIEYSNVQNTSAQFQLKKAKDLLVSSSFLTSKSNEGRLSLEKLLMDILGATDGTLALLKSGKSLTKSAPAGADESTLNDYADYNQQISDFHTQLLFTDSSLGIENNSSALLLGGQKKPTEYLDSAGRALGVKIGLAEISQALGLDNNQAEAAATLATNIRNVFFCGNGQWEHPDGSCSSFSASLSPIGIASPITGNSPATWGTTRNNLYHNWGFLYDNLDKIFQFRLDSQANLPDGTISKLINSPNTAFSTFLEIAANKLDTQYGFTSSSIRSFSGLYRVLLPDITNNIQATCHAYTFPNSEDTDLDRQMAAAQAELKNANGDEDRALAKHKIDGLNDEFLTRKTKYDLCVEEARYAYNISQTNIDTFDLGGTFDVGRWAGRVWEWGQQAAADYLHNQIANLTVKQPGCTGSRCDINVGIDMPTSDIRQLMRGDLRYAGAAAAAMGANIVTIALDNITTNNCNPKEKGTDGCRAPVPAGMRISYDEIKLAFFGLPQNEIQHIAAFNEATEGAYKIDPDRYQVSGTHTCEPGKVWSGIACIAQVNIVNNASASIHFQAEQQYGYSAANIEAEKTKLRNSIKTLCEEQGLTGQALADCQNNQNNSLTSFYWNRLNLLEHPETYNSNNSTFAEDVQNSVKKAAANKLKYDIIDIGLWKLDDNIYPGFAQAVATGSTGEKWAALAQYTKNGLVSGHLFGIKFDGIDQNLVEGAAYIVAYMSAPNDAEKQKVFEKISTEKFDSVINFISDHTEKWLGFKLDRNMTEGLITSIASGKWGLDSFSLDGVFGNPSTNGNTTAFAGRTDRFTFGGAVVNFGLGKIFNWTDKVLGLKQGQSLELFTEAKNVYSAYKDYQAAKSAYELAKSQSELEAASKALDAASAKLTQAYSAGVQKAVSILVSKFLGETISEWENQLDLVPGTLEPIISGAIYEGIAAAANAVAGSTVLTSIGPYGWGMMAAMFLIQNLFGVYRVEYWCSADGYFPYIGNPNPEKNDVTDVGIFGGKVGWKNLNDIIQKGSIRAAQYKANRLIGDMLQIQYSSQFNDKDGQPTVPIQMMTGRDADVAYWKDTVATNVCQVRGNFQLLFSGNAAVCDAGLKRMGLWQNPQTVAWTHIGF